MPDDAIARMTCLHPDILFAFDELMRVRAMTRSAVLSQAAGRTLNRIMVAHGFTRDAAHHPGAREAAFLLTALCLRRPKRMPYMTLGNNLGWDFRRP
jgi:hypothetical protein